MYSIVPSTKWQFYVFLSSLDSFHFFFFFFSAVLGLRVLYWIKMTRVGILVLLVILEETLSGFHCFIWCWLWVCHIWSLLCWGMFLLSSVYWKFLSKWMLNFVGSFFCICWDDHMIFIFSLLTWCIMCRYWTILASLG